MGKPDGLDRIAQLLIALAALAALGNGGFMLWDPFGWYQVVPTVKFTGPANPHFIRDIGLAYIMCSLVLGFAAGWPNGRWMAAFVGNLWLTAHGLLHIWEVSTGVCAPDIFWRDAPGVLGPPLLVWVALALLFARQRITFAGIPKPILMKGIEQLNPGEFAYMREIAAAPGHAFAKMMQFMSVTRHRCEASAELSNMAKIGATLVEDCGPCAITAGQAALGEGVSRELVNAALASNPPAGDCKLAFDFGQAIARQSVGALELGDAIEARFGRTVRLELSMVAATVRSYPAMKRGLGLTKACSLTKLEI